MYFFEVFNKLLLKIFSAKYNVVIVSINFTVLVNFIGAINLNLNNQFGVTENDCYTRMYIGFQYADNGTAMIQNFQGTLDDCKDECSRRQSNCSTISYGVSGRSNTSCMVTMRMPQRENLQPNPDYDVYTKSQNLLTCEDDEGFYTPHKKHHDVHHHIKEETHHNYLHHHDPKYLSYLLHLFTEKKFKQKHKSHYYYPSVIGNRKDQVQNTHRRYYTNPQYRYVYNY